MNEAVISQKLDEYKLWHEHQIWAESVGDIGYIKRDKALKEEIEEELRKHGLKIIKVNNEFQVVNGFE